jgi:DNA-binding NarL/FixJ family response regulator
MASLKTRVVVIDDHPIVVEGLTGALTRHDRLEVVGSAGSVAAGRALIESVAPDVVLLDLRLSDGSGTEILAEFQRRESGPAFIVLSTFLTTQYVNASIALGASGFLLKTTPTIEIAEAIDEVASGHLAFTAEQLRASWRAGWTPLTSRERDIVEGVTAGLSNDELSMRLQVSHKTVEAYLSRLFERFAVVTRTELAVLAEREQWLALPTQRTGRSGNTTSPDMSSRRLATARHCRQGADKAGRD